MRPFTTILLCSLLASTPLARAETSKPAARTVLDCNRQSAPTITATDRSYRVVGACKKVTVSGPGNSVTIESAEAIAITGDDNTVLIEKADTIATSGSRNHVTYRQHGVKHREPKVTTRGKANEILIMATLDAKASREIQAALRELKAN